MRKWTLGALFSSAVLSSAALVAPAPAFAMGPVLGLGAPDAVPGRYIVTLKEGARGPRAASLGSGRVTHRFTRVAGFAARLTELQAHRLAGDPAVRSVEQDRVVRIAGTQKNPGWGLDRIDQRSVKRSKTYTPTDDGSAVHAYVIDTGIRTTHQQFGGRATSGYDFADDDSDASDCNGHGTHVAGTIGGSTYGVAKKVQLVAVRVLDCDGEGTLADVIDGVDWVTEHAVKPAVANMSMGGSYSASLDYAVEESIASGVTYVVAAGNEDVNALKSSPADVPAAVTVAASDSRDRRAYFSNYGSVVDIFAPGVDITSAVATGNTAKATWSGTSMASPHVAGAAALILDANPSYTPAQVRNRLVANATTGKVTDRMGSPNRLLFVPAPPAKPVIATSSVPAGTVFRSYAKKLALKSARTGSWSVASGSLPPGLTLSSGGTLAGTPTTPGTYAVVVRFTDYVPQSITRALTITIASGTPVIATESLPDATTDSDYAAQLGITDARDGTWALDSGELPDGLSLSESGQISGVPSTAGTSTFTVRFTDVWDGTTTRELTLTVG
ncbi:S8 family peptidase [Actinoplanes sp. NPDC051851]|uniref:S8 family peptidase n=1 Tax=Actinoplanes sp. NPDC051851 TaxID=3154753 RepID=UPI003434A765